VTYSWQAAPLLRTASLPRRTLAFAIDAVVVFGLAWTVTFMLAAAGLLRVPDVQLLGENSAAAGLLWIVSIFELPLLLLYTTLFEGFGGRTPGKLLLGLRVARDDAGGRIGLFPSFLRNLLKLLWVTPVGPVFVVIDAFALRATELDQRIGDIAAGTVVLDERTFS
jgi:uncharacterized RDD family membrane protein YckC